VAIFDTTTEAIAFWTKTSAQQLASIEVELSTSAAEAQVIHSIAKSRLAQDKLISRHDFSLAFDPIAEPERKSPWSTTSSLDCSVFDRTSTMIAEDVAPYVRGIVAHDAALQLERTRLSNLLSEGGRKPGKRMRTTRAALSALEGGARSTTRPERYFPNLNSVLVLKTGLPAWQDAVLDSRADLEKSVSDDEGMSPGSSVTPSM
jgi:hypothetical protein